MRINVYQKNDLSEYKSCKKKSELTDKVANQISYALADAIFYLNKWVKPWGFRNCIIHQLN